MNANSRFSLLLLVAWFLPRTALVAAPPGTVETERTQAVPKTPETPSRNREARAEAHPINACSPDGKYFVSAARDGKLRYGRAEDGFVLYRFYHCSPQSVVFSKDGRFLACAGGLNEGAGKIKVWDLSDGGLRCMFLTELAEMPSLAFSPDGLLLACTTSRSRIGLWTIADGTTRWSVSLNRAVREVRFSGDGSAVLARCADGITRALAVADGALLRSRVPEEVGEN